MDSVHAGGLGGTYSGNPVACAAALGAVAEIEENDLLHGRGTSARASVPACRASSTSRRSSGTSAAAVRCSLSNS